MRRLYRQHVPKAQAARVLEEREAELSSAVGAGKPPRASGGAPRPPTAKAAAAKAKLDKLQRQQSSQPGGDGAAAAPTGFFSMPMPMVDLDARGGRVTPGPGCLALSLWRPRLRIGRSPPRRRAASEGEAKRVRADEGLPRRESKPRGR